MEVLTGISLYGAMIRCRDNKNYKAIVVFATLANAKDFTKELAKELCHSCFAPEIDNVVVGFRNSSVNFKNGSRIELTTLTENARGNKCNEVICESGVDITDDRVRDLLQCMLVPYKCEAYEIMDNHPLGSSKRHEEATQRSEELDEFLQTFSITQ